MRSRKLALLIFSLMIIPNVGCQSWCNIRDAFYYCEPIDEAIHSHNCHRAAKRAWTARQDRFCGRERLDYFGAGFRDGYASVAMGGTGCPPPLPPQRYWGWRYQNCEGQQCVASWFDGYPAGARAAEEDGVGNWNRMQTSYIIDAQYAARMGGGRKNGPLPPGGAFPGEEFLEEVPAAPVALPETSVPEPAIVPFGGENESVRVIRNLDQATPVTAKVGRLPKIVSRPKIVSASEEQPSETIASGSTEQTPLRSLESTEAAEEGLPSVVRKFEMPAVEMLSGVSVPKKQAAASEEVETPELAESDSAEVADETQEVVDNSKPALMRTPALAPIVTPFTAKAAPPVAGIVEETPAYSLGGESTVASPVSTKKSLPPIVPVKPKKQTPPIVRPVEEQGRFTKNAKATPAKQVSYESDEDEEIPGLRRIGKAK